MRNRVDKLGVTEPEIHTQGDDQIVIQLPGVKDPEAAAEIIGTTAQLELFDLETSLVGPSISIQGQPVETRRSTRSSRRSSRRSKDGSEAYYVVNPKTKRVVSGPYGSEEEALKRSGGKLPAGRELFAVPDGHGRHHLRRGRGRLPRRATARASRRIARGTTSSSTTRRTSRR